MVLRIPAGYPEKNVQKMKKRLLQMLCLRQSFLAENEVLQVPAAPRLSMLCEITFLFEADQIDPLSLYIGVILRLSFSCVDRRE